MSHQGYNVKNHTVKTPGKKMGKRRVSMPPYEEPQRVKGPKPESATTQKDVRKPTRQMPGKKGKR